MNRKKVPHDARAQLRADAEARLSATRLGAAAVPSPDTVLHELQVHQVELEMQNEELRRAQVELQESRDRYLDLYEFAPVGYLTLTRTGLISQVNLTGAMLLGEERKKLLRRRFSQLVAIEDRDRYHRLFLETMQHEIQQSADLALRRSDQSSFHAQLDCVRVEGQEGPPTMRVTLIDISVRKRAEAEIERLAYYDSLTLLPNRRLLRDRLQQAVKAHGRTGRQGAILYIDLDDFKALNDTQGHDIGDMLLQHVARRLLASVRAGDTVARIGGDEFVVVLEDLSDDPHTAAVRAETIGEKILAEVGRPHFLAGHEHHGAASVGITLFSDGEVSVDDLLKRADLAMYRAKSEGRATVRFFDPTTHSRVMAKAAREVDLRRGTREGEFVVHYQPQVDGEGRITGVEALLRWNHPVEGMLLPGDFLPLAERTGLIHPLGQWVLQVACAQLAAWSTNPDTAHLTIAVNISASELGRPEFAAHSLAALHHARADPTRLVMEFGEGVPADLTDRIAKMTLLKSHGVRLALDHFGTGDASLSYLRHLPLDQLKIGRGFVQGVLTSAVDAAIASSIVALGHGLGLSVVAAGVETVGEHDFLASQGCRTFSGYLFGRPGPIESLGNTGATMDGAWN